MTGAITALPAAVPTGTVVTQGQTASNNGTGNTTNNGTGNTTNNGGPAAQTYTGVLYTADTPPAPVGYIATELHKIPTLEQHQMAEEFFTKIDNATPDLLQLNALKKAVAFLVGVPETSMVKLMFAPGFGTPSVNGQSPLDDTILGLTGEGGPDIGFPEVLVLDSNQLTAKVNCLVPTDQKVKTDLTATPQFGNFLLNPLHVTTKEDIYRWAVIPAFYCYDGVHQDLSAAVLYERLMLCTTQSSMITHAQTFLRAMLVGKLRGGDTKPWIAPEDWRKVAPVEAKIWRKQKCEEIFPTLFTPAPTIPAGPPPASTTTTAITAQNQFGPEFFLQMYKIMREEVTKTSFVEEKKEDMGNTDLKISEMEARTMKWLCGHNIASDNSVLPSWFHQILAKHQTDNDKDMIIASALTQQARFEDQRITIYPELRNMIRKRAWTGNEAGAIPQFAQACYGLTPFAMLDLTLEEVANMEHDHQLENTATTITFSDLKGAKKKMKASIPADGYKWLASLLEYTNLLQNLFGSGSPMYLRMLDLCKALRRYDINVILLLSHLAKAAISWCTHLQSRHYAHGKMHLEHPGGELLPEFKWMYNMVCSGQVHNVSIATLPRQLQRATGPKPPEGGTGGNTPQETTSLLGKRSFRGEDISDERLAKLLKLEEQEKNRNNPSKIREPWNSELKAQLADPLKRAKYPSLHRITQYCKLTSQDTLVPNVDRKTCRNFLVLGKCRWGPKCTMHHKTATEEQTASILEKLEQFIAKPEDIPAGKQS